MTEYRLVWAYALEDLQSLVNTFVQSGWQIYGYPFVMGNQLIQPMILYTPLPPLETPTETQP